MPIYEYRCENCGHTFEQRERLDEHAAHQARCPKCGSEHLAHVFSSFFAKTSKKS